MDLDYLSFNAYLWAFIGMNLAAYLCHEYACFCMKQNVPALKSFCYADAVKRVVFPGKCHQNLKMKNKNLR